jgi:hypothetical protein
MAVDCVGRTLSAGQECVFSRNLWRGREVLCKGTIKTVSDKYITVEVTSPNPPGVDLYEGWNIVKRAITTKVYGL